MWQSPIAPGLSWYQASAGDRPAYAGLDGSTTTDVAIIGGGFTGLQAAYNLAKAGVQVTLIDGARFGDGASGRNGGQIGTGQRSWPDEMEPQFGYDLTRAMFDMAERAKQHLIDFAETHGIDMELMRGYMSVSHKPGKEKDYQQTAETMAKRYGYPHVRFMDGQETAERVGSKRFPYGVYDEGSGHIHPLKLVIGLARVAAAAGARLHELSPAIAIRQNAGKTLIDTPRGTITADRVLVATNAYVGNLEPVTSAHIMPIQSFIGATVPLDRFPSVIPGSEAIADSRFMVRYWRKSRDGRLIFGGREAYTAASPGDISIHIRRQIAEIYPELGTVEISHSWGGSVGITLPRKPFVREVMPGVTSIGGYSGHGVMLANYCGKLYADELTGKTSDLDYYRGLKVPPFPGGKALRAPLLFLALTWYALLDKM
nr:FAD-binding oxidoreductase [uncultured Gellertiella sp.]